MVRSALCTLALFLASSLATAAADIAPSSQQPVARQSVSLLLTTFYRKLSAPVVIDAERSALLAYLHAHGAPQAQLPSVPSTLDEKTAGDAAAGQIAAAVATRKISEDVAVAIGVKAMASAAHDRYTTYFTKSEFRSFDEMLDPAKLSGIGILMRSDPLTKYLQAFFVVPDTPADRAGMKSGDDITFVDGHSTHGFTVEQGRKYLLGAAGTKIRLTIASGGNAPATVTVTRAQIQPPTVYFTMLPKKIAYIYLAAFGDATPTEFRTAISRSEAAGARGYVLDLRNDGGGRVSTALAVTSQFIPTGPIVSIESKGGEIDTFEADNTAITPKPLAVLVNAYSASASEITAAALQESGTGVLIGEKTFGKGVVQSVTNFSDGSAIKITTGRYYTPLHHDINGHGIVPNVVVGENLHAIFGTPGKDAQLTKAIQVIESSLAQRAGAGVASSGT